MEGKQMLITFEGLDSLGKTTLIKEVSKEIACTTTKEPGSPHIPLNVEFRKLVLENKALSPMQRELLFYADALGHASYLKDISGLVLSDRGLMTHYAYLFGYMKLGMLGPDRDANYTRYGLCKKLIKEVCAVPDAVVYLEGSIALMQERMQREKDAIESLPSSFFSYVLAQYDDLLIGMEYEQKPLLILDAKSSVEENKAKTLQFITDLQNRQVPVKLNEWEIIRN